MLSKVWTEDEVVEATYRVATNVYYRSALTRLRYDKDDFLQDAALFILNKFRDKYFEITTDNAEPLIYSLLNNWFKRNAVSADYKHYRRVVYMDRSLSDSSVNSSSAGNNMIFSNLMKSSISSPDAVYEYEVAVSSGKRILDNIIDSLDVTPYNSRKYNYIGKDEDFGKIKLSESNLARLLVSGKDLHSILTIYGNNTNNAGSSSPSAFIARKVKETKERLVDLIKGLPHSEKNDVIVYMESIK